ncbi:MAG: NAD-dependent epimerase/dehydratase family protein [Spirochaetia bacterium]|nr:NAD-dependent epimerase/dehydratase family protein [Spirochaetia bacterium]
MKILVTGGAGFIGSHIADRLLANKHSVAIVDNLTTGKKENIPREAQFYEADICDKHIAEIFEKEKPQILVHQAAQINVRASVDDPGYDASINIIGSINLLECARKYGVQKVIFASTGGAIYGEQEYFPADENHPQNPVSPYGIAKLSVEKYLYYYKVQYGLDFVSLRYANVYGPRQNAKGEAGVVAIFCERMLKNEQPIINGDGRQTRDYVYVADVAEYNIRAVESDASGIFNIGTSKEINVNEIFYLIKNELKSEAPEVHGDAKGGEQLRSVITFQKANETFGHEPQVQIEEGIRKTAKWFQQG